MRVHVDCFPCYFRQVLQAGRYSTSDTALHLKAAQALAAWLIEMPPGANSIWVAEEAHRRIREALGDPDPYRSVKDDFTARVEAMRDRIGRIAASGDDPFLSAVRVAIAGNIIDFGAGTAFDLDRAVDDALVVPFAIDHTDALRRAADAARTVLYIADNTGEIYFDIPLLRLLDGRDITFVVRGAPVLNDATTEYALRAGIDRFARIADTGNAAPGFILDSVRPEVRDLFHSADLVIGKGQGNFESLHEHARPGLFFLMKIKCDLVARLMHATLGDIQVMDSTRLDFKDL